MLKVMKRNRLSLDANNLSGHTMSLPLPFDEFSFDGNVYLEEEINTLADFDIGCFLDVDLRYAYNIRQKTKHFPICPENKILS